MEKPEIVVKNSSIQIRNYRFGSCPRLENCFMVFNPTTHSSHYVGIAYDEEKEILYVPRGIDIWYVEKLLETEAKVEKNSFDEFDTYTDIKIKYLPRDDEQKESLRFMLGKKEYKATSTKSQLSVNLNTGKGKTYVSIATFAYTGIKSMIITYSTGWLKQWKEKILEYTNLREKDICFITGSNTIYRLITMSPEKIYQYKIFLVTHSTLKSYGDNNGWDKVEELFRILKVGIKIYDEAHMNFSNMCMIDYHSNVYKTYYLTATPTRSDPRENMIYQTSFKNVLSIDLFNPETDPHSNYWAILYDSKPEPYVVSACKNQYGLDRNKYMNYIVTNDNFMKMATIVIDMAMNIIYREGTYKDKMLIYIGTNQAIEEFVNKIVDIIPDMRGQIGIFTSAVSPEEKELAKEKKYIFTTTKSAGAALDIAHLKVVILLDEPFTSELLARQTIGRLRDKDTYYFEVVDTGFYYCKKYYQKKKPIFSVYAKECDQSKITDNELNNRYDRITERMANMPSPMEIVES